MSLFENVENNKTFIKELKNGDKVSTFFKIIKISKKIKKNGEPYLSLTLQDKTGKIEAKIWEEIEKAEKLLDSGKIYEIEGYVKEFRGNLEIVINKFSTPKPESYNKDDFIEEAKFDIDKVFDEMIEFLKQRINNNYLSELVELFSQKYKDKFKNHYGAMKIHHSYRGGLLEHTFSIIKLADFISEHYNLDKELLLIGALFHDIGKIYEFETIEKEKTTIQGGLLGHIIIGNSIFIEMTKEVRNFPEDISLKIQHLIISHHGEKEFGSPEMPKTQEAFALHILDLLDSKINIFKELIKSNTNENDFSDYINVLGRRILIKDDK